MYNTALDALKQMGEVVKSLYDKVSSFELFVRHYGLTVCQATTVV